MRVLVACEFSATVRDAFRKRGHDAWSCDLLPTEGDSDYHFQGDVFKFITRSRPFDLMIAHPPCTYLTNSGVTWLYNKDGSRNAERWVNLDEGAQFFRELSLVDIPRKAIENPIQHKHAVERHGMGRPSQYVQPWMFGHMEQKATGFHLYGLPKLVPTKNVKDEMMKLSPSERQRLHYMPPGPDRWKERSRTYQGVADAMSEQWGAL